MASRGSNNHSRLCMHIYSLSYGACMLVQGSFASEKTLRMSQLLSRKLAIFDLTFVIWQ